MHNGLTRLYSVRSWIPLHIWILKLVWTDWIDFTLDLPGLIVPGLKCLLTASATFEALGNSGSACWCRWRAASFRINAERSERIRNHPEFQRVKIGNDSLHEMYQIRHPDPGLISKMKVEHKNLQLEGSWLKVKNSGSLARSDFASFVWKSESSPSLPNFY
jgi:hypothetical protein